ncbi:YdcF family protein [Pedobacter duraquae]|uniref:Uncharacterized SAM-binding protein YcdF (DUF218 family) n=1 Tax=Pedobacter duraquae TaxID=425511 RepID=A0A4R6IQY2_9SPHI|nr:YdcF family protein [Pedobacter duraquae]TDO24769.1 uncharacterized SAM-binding protein YcdF (DUF218 family) [Pedobacter duraquae]
MFFFLSKTLQYLTMPLVWITILMICSLFLKKAAFKKKTLLAAIILLMLFGSDFLAKEAMRLWETPKVSMKSLPHHNTAIVLGGIISPPKKADEQANFNRAANRLLIAVQLFKMGKIDTILVAGGGSDIKKEDLAESEQLKRYLIYCGVPDSSILIEKRSKNTMENARFSRLLIDQQSMKGPFLIITSAFHMKRALGCFNRVGLKVDPFPVDYYPGERSFSFAQLFIPSEDGLTKSTLLIHEIVGYLVYRLMGYA